MLRNLPHAAYFLKAAASQVFIYLLYYNKLQTILHVIY